MTSFFATPEETWAWLRSEAERLRLSVRDEALAGGDVRCFVWPSAEQALAGPVSGVHVFFPSVRSNVLAPGLVDWKASAFTGHTEVVGRRLLRSLVRSMRKQATVPLHAMSVDRTSIAAKPSAWATPGALSRGLPLRQFHDGGCWFVTGETTPWTSPALPDDDRWLYEGEGRDRRT